MAYYAQTQVVWPCVGHLINATVNCGMFLFIYLFIFIFIYLFMFLLSIWIDELNK